MIMRFRETKREVENFQLPERVTDNHDAYKEIKPQTNITIEEAMSFWDNVFSKEIEEEEK